MAKIVKCGVCGKSFALTDENYNRLNQVDKVAKAVSSNAKAYFICQFCKVMVNEKN